MGASVGAEISIGLRYVNGSATWQDERPFQYDNWASNQPMLGQPEGDCGYIVYGNGLTPALWHTASCGRLVRSALCKRASGEKEIKVVIGALKSTHTQSVSSCPVRAVMYSHLHQCTCTQSVYLKYSYPVSVFLSSQCTLIQSVYSYPVSLFIVNLGYHYSAGVATSPSTIAYDYVSFCSAVSTLHVGSAVPNERNRLLCRVVLKGLRAAVRTKIMSTAERISISWNSVLFKKNR